MTIVILIIAAFFLMLGLIFRIFRPVDVLSGISAENITDPEGLGVWVGNSLTTFAAIYALIAAGLHLSGIDLSGASTSTIILAGLFLLGHGLFVSYIMGTGKFTKTTALPPRTIETDDETSA